MNFDLFVGIDWSGAKGPRLPGLQAAACAAEGPIRLTPGPWTRPVVADWLLDRVADGKRVLCGLDFSFCFPWVDQNAYLPGYADNPDTPEAFWDLIERETRSDDGLFGGRFADAKPYDRYFHRRGMRGDRFERRLRVAEVATQEQGLGTPESVFNLVGARQVGKSSLAGMRFLRQLKEHEGVAVWPFDRVEGAQLVLVETFPTAFVRMAGEGAGKVRERPRLEAALSFFGAKMDLDLDAVPTDDQTDALITASALRTLSGRAEMWNPPGMSDMVRRKEGWTFGIL